jgi:hypothetical protein
VELTVGNIPALDGTLVVIDTSVSMQAPVARRSTMQRVEVAAVMALATAKRAADVDVVIYGQDNALVRGLHGASVLAGVDQVVRSVVRSVTPPLATPPSPAGSSRAGTTGRSSSPTTSSTTRAESGSTTCR